VAFSLVRSCPPTTGVVGDDPARQHRPIRLDPLPDGHEAERVETSERGQVRASEGSVKQVEVSWIRRVGTLIPGGTSTPTRSATRRRPATSYTLKREESHSRHRRASVLAVVTRRQEVTPMNAVSVGASLESTIPRLR
jgi:hypothetical protein